MNAEGIKSAMLMELFFISRQNSDQDLLCQSSGAALLLFCSEGLPLPVLLWFWALL